MFLFVNYYEYERSTFRVDKVLIIGENDDDNNDDDIIMKIIIMMMIKIIFPQ